jgi:hypothetical protein
MTYCPPSEPECVSVQQRPRLHREYSIAIYNVSADLIYPLISAEQMLSRTRWRLIRLC